MYVHVNAPVLTGGQAERKALLSDRLVSVLNGKSDGQSPLEEARQSLLNARSRLEEQRDERIEQALGGYKALRSRQTSYENELSAQQNLLEDFRSLSSRRDALSEELSGARADCEAADGSAPEGGVADVKRSLRAASLEQKLAGADRDLAALVERANRYANGKRQYADYLEKTEQGGYAAFEYRGRPGYTGENFASEAAGMIGRLEAGADQWREHVSSYCDRHGLTAYDFESYMEDRRKLGSAYFNARQRYAELLYAADGAELGESAGAVEQAEDAAPKRSFDTVELGGEASAQRRG